VGKHQASTSRLHLRSSRKSQRSLLATFIHVFAKRLVLQTRIRQHGGLWTIQLIEHQHRRRRRRWTFVRAYAAFTSLYVCTDNRQRKYCKSNGQPAPEQRRALRTTQDLDPRRLRRRTLRCFDDTSPATGHRPVWRSLWRLGPVEALHVVSKGSRDGDTIANGY
jgi:hypothetical protein